MTRALAFADGSRLRDYGLRLARLRWLRASGADRLIELDASGPVGNALGGAGELILVADSRALPAVSALPAIPQGGVLVGRAASPDPPLHTLRELESIPVKFSPRIDDAPLAWGFRSDEIGIGENDTAAELVRRLRGAGAGVAAARRRHPRWRVTGVERDPDLARRARFICDRVLEGDLREVLPRLALDGETFDALVFGDVLEHLADPLETLRAARSLEVPCATLVASVPTVAHLSILRDLLHGRFDPLPAGLCDAGHLRWFTRSSLAEALEEAGWDAIRVEPEAGSPPPEPDALLELAGGWPEGDPESLRTYQWVGTAAAGDPS